MDFELTSTFKPTGDQPQAIKEITEAVQSGTDAITLLGVTGSGKTFTMANVIQNLQRPALVLLPARTQCSTSRVYGQQARRLTSLFRCRKTKGKRLKRNVS